MRRVLVDTGPLVALCDPRDGLHARALAEVGALRVPRLVCLPVLTEAFHLLAAGPQRTRLGEAFSRGLFELANPPGGERVAQRAMAWLEAWGEHDPDLADAYLVAWSELDAELRVWTFDRELRGVWRTSKGRRVPLAPA